MSVSLDLQNMANIDFQYWIYKNKCISGKKKSSKNLYWLFGKGLYRFALYYEIYLY